MDIGGKSEEGQLTRREILTKAAAGVALGAAALAVFGEAAGRPAAAGGTVPQASTGLQPNAVKRWPVKGDWENKIWHLEQELQKDLQKPIEQRKWGMVIDLRKCVGCAACTVACKAENHLPPGVVYRPVMEEEVGRYPNVGRHFLPRPCMQCAEPPCVAVCPVGASYQRPDAIVAIDYEKCIGCRYCISACPYGARSFDFGLYYTKDSPAFELYEKDPSPEYGKKWVRDKNHSPIGNARKCTFCLHRLTEGMLPACVTTCIGGATYFGDLNDPQSLIVELLAQQGIMRLKEELGTEPKVYYLT